MPAINFSNEDIKSGFLVKNPGRYNYKCTGIKAKPSKDGQSTNYLFQWRGLNGEMEGVVVFVQLNEKAKWLFAPLFKAANGGKDLVAGQSYEIDDLRDIELSAMTVRGQREDGAQFNNLVDWGPKVG